MFGLRPVCGALFLQGGGESGRCKRVVPTVSRLRMTIEGLSIRRLRV